MAENTRDANSVNDLTDARRVAREAEAVEVVEVEVDSKTDGGDVSPHLGGRAQPGDILGLETGGETTSLGDTAEDEDEKRRNVIKK